MVRHPVLELRQHTHACGKPGSGLLLLLLLLLVLRGREKCADAMHEREGMVACIFARHELTGRSPKPWAPVW